MAPGPALLNAHSKHSSSGNRGCSRSNLRLTQGCRHSNNTHLPHLLSATISLSSPGDFSSLGTHLPAPVLNPGAFSWLCKHFPSPNAKPRCDLRAQKTHHLFATPRTEDRFPQQRGDPCSRIFLWAGKSRRDLMLQPQKVNQNPPSRPSRKGIAMGTWQRHLQASQSATSPADLWPTCGQAEQSMLCHRIP